MPKENPVLSPKASKETWKPPPTKQNRTQEGVNRLELPFFQIILCSVDYDKPLKKLQASPRPSSEKQCQRKPLLLVLMCRAPQGAGKEMPENHKAGRKGVSQKVIYLPPICGYQSWNTIAEDVTVNGHNPRETKKKKKKI